jgi:hypothetical protein
VKTYRVYGHIEKNYFTDIQAKNMEKAREMAEDGEGDWDEVYDYADSIIIVDRVEVKEE